MVFDPPARVLARAAFARRIASRGVVLDRRTRLLYDARRLYINGAAVESPAGGATALKNLANQRRLSAAACAALGEGVLAMVHDWFLAPGA